MFHEQLFVVGTRSEEVTVQEKKISHAVISTVKQNLLLLYRK